MSVCLDGWDRRGWKRRIRVEYGEGANLWVARVNDIKGSARVLGLSVIRYSPRLVRNMATSLELDRTLFRTLSLNSLISLSRFRFKIRSNRGSEITFAQITTTLVPVCESRLLPTHFTPHLGTYTITAHRLTSLRLIPQIESWRNRASIFPKSSFSSSSRSLLYDGT